nr:leucyl aminopeptidase family protein [Alsobacter ponti]
MCVSAADWRSRADALGDGVAAFAQAQGFEGKAGQTAFAPGAGGKPAAVLWGVGDGVRPSDPFLPAKLAQLPEGVYRLDGFGGDATLAALAFALGGYRFDRYRARPAPRAVRLVMPDGVDGDAVRRVAEAVAMGRDLINTPASDLGPAELETAVRNWAQARGVALAVTVGDDLLAANFPMVHAVGRGSSRAPRLLDLTWGEESAPKVTLVGKGVCFDTGGLNIKNDAGMLLMKKDMGGAATALAIAQMVVEARLKVRLRVLVPAVENAISGTSFRPGDVLRSRKGLTVEIGNTDAEGRLILADALALADEEQPDLLVDFATLTGAARVALGPDLPPFYTDDEALAADVARTGAAVNDPVWRMPLWKPYDAMLDSKIADMNNVTTGGFAGSVTAALFLRRFVEKAKAWAHFDIYGWTPAEKPGRPFGGEPQAARLVFALLQERYAR